MADFDDENLINPNIEDFQRLTLHPAVTEDIQGAIKYINKWVNSVDEASRKNIEVRCYDTFPTALYLFIDKDQDDGFVIVSPTFPYLDFNDRPAFKVKHSDDKILFENLCKSFDSILKESKEPV